MRVEYINPFVETSFQILKEVLGGADDEGVYVLFTELPVGSVHRQYVWPLLRQIRKNRFPGKRTFQ